MITQNELQKIARLAKLSLAGEDMDAIMADMTNIISVAQSIDGADLSNLDCAGDSVTVALREDIVMPSLPAEVILSNAAVKRDGCFSAPAGTNHPALRGHPLY